MFGTQALKALYERRAEVPVGTLIAALDGYQVDLFDGGFLYDKSVQKALVADAMKDPLVDSKAFIKDDLSDNNGEMSWEVEGGNLVIKGAIVISWRRGSVLRPIVDGWVGMPWKTIRTMFVDEEGQWSPEAGWTGACFSVDEHPQQVRLTKYAGLNGQKVRWAQDMTDRTVSIPMTKVGREVLESLLQMAAGASL